jgi:hypothetical protein
MNKGVIRRKNLMSDEPPANRVSKEREAGRVGMVGQLQLHGYASEGSTGYAGPTE